MALEWYILKDKKPVLVTSDEWEKARREEPDSFRVAYTEIGGASVSTVLLGLDYQMLTGGKPMLFETLHFDGEIDRYETYEEAVKGHWKAVGRCLLLKLFKEEI